MGKINWKRVKVCTPIRVLHDGVWTDGYFAGNWDGRKWCNSEEFGLIKFQRGFIVKQRSSIVVEDINGVLL